METVEKYIEQLRKQGLADKRIQVLVRIRKKLLESNMAEPETDEDDREECETCNGNGWVDDPSDGGTMTCEDCDGEGKV